MVTTTCQFAAPLVLQSIVGGLSCYAAAEAAGVPPEALKCPSRQSLYSFAILLTAANVLFSVAASHERYMLSIAGLRIRNKLMAAVFRKTLTLSSGALAEENAGRIVTLMSNDAQKIQEFFPAIHELWAVRRRPPARPRSPRRRPARAFPSLPRLHPSSAAPDVCPCPCPASAQQPTQAPALIGVALWLLFRVLEWATFVGMGAIFLTVPLTGIIAGKLFGIRKEIVKCADKRVNLVSEVINGMRVIKFYAWCVLSCTRNHSPLSYIPDCFLSRRASAAHLRTAPPTPPSRREASFKERIAEIRKGEVGLIWRTSKIGAMFGLLLFSAPTLIGVAAIGTFCAPPFLRPDPPRISPDSAPPPRPIRACGRR